MKLPRPYSLGELADLAEKKINGRLAELGGDDLTADISVKGDSSTIVKSVCPIENLEEGCITFAVKGTFRDLAEKGGAAAVVLSPGIKCSLPGLYSAWPRLVFSVILEICQAPPSIVPGHSGLIRFKDKSSLSLGHDAVIGDFCYVGKNVKIGNNSRIYPHVFIDDDVTIGESCIVYPRVTLFRNTRLGRKVIIHSGAVIGDDGFGYNQAPDLKRGRLHHLKNEHLGGVLIDDFAEIGSQVCVDRGLAGETVVGAGTKIDNLTQIAHNVKIGRDSIIVNSSFAGSSQTGDRVFVVASKIRDGVKIGDDAIVLGGSEVHHDIPSGRAQWAGRPAQPSNKEWKQRALIKRELPRVRKFFSALKNANSFDDLKSAFFDK